MATDAYAKFDGVSGESTDDKHKEWIEVLSFSWGLSQPTSVSSATGGRSAERVNVSDFSIMKSVDTSTPHLMQRCCDGKHLKSVEIELCLASGDKHPYMKYTFDDCIVSSVQVSGSGGGDKPTEQISVNFGKYKVEYTPVDQQGKAGSKVGPLGWNLEENKKV